MNNEEKKTEIQGFLRDAPDCYRGLEASPIITLDKPYMYSEDVQKVEVVLDRSSIFDPRALLEGTDTTKSRKDAFILQDLSTTSEKVTFLQEQGYQAVAVAHIPYDPNREIVLFDTDTEIKPVAHDDKGINIEPHGKGFERLLEKNRLPNEYLSKTLPFDRNHSHVTIGTSLQGLGRIIADSGTENQREKDVLYLDVASTGLNPRRDAIMEIAIIDDRNHTLFESLVHPERGIPPEASHRYAITDDMVNDAPTLKEITPQIKDILSSADQVMVYGSDGPEKLLPENILGSTRITPVINVFSDIHGSLNEPDLPDENRPVQSLHLAAGHAGYRPEVGGLERSLPRAQALRAIWKWTEKQLELLPENTLSRSNEITTAQPASNENQTTREEVSSRFKEGSATEDALDEKQTSKGVVDPRQEQSVTKAKTVSTSLLEKVTAQGSMQIGAGWVKVNVYEIYHRASDDPFSRLSADEQVRSLRGFPLGYDKVASVVANTDIDTVVEMTSGESDWFKRGFVEPHVDAPRLTDTGDVIVKKNFQSPDTVHVVDAGMEVSEVSQAIEKRSRQYVLFHREDPAPASGMPKDKHFPNLDIFPKGYTRVATFQGNRDPEGIDLLTRESHWPQRFERLEGIETHEKGARETGPGDILLEKDNRGVEVFHILESDGIRELRTLENANGAIENVSYSDHPKARNWIARVHSGSPGRESLNREFLSRASEGRFFSEKISVGDLLEFGGDQLTANGERIKNRAYFEVLGTNQGLKMREIDPSDIHKASEKTAKHDPEAGGPPDKSESQDRIQAYRGTTTKIGSHRSQGRYFTLDKPIDDQSRTYMGISEISIDKSKIYDPHGQIEGTYTAKSRENMYTIETTVKLRMDPRLEKDDSPEAQLAKAQIRAEVLSDYGYQAEAALTVFKDGFTRDLVVISDQVSANDLPKHMEETIKHDPWPQSAKLGAMELLSNYMSEARMAEIGLTEISILPEDRSSDELSHLETKSNPVQADRIPGELSARENSFSPDQDLPSKDLNVHKDSMDKTDSNFSVTVPVGPEHLHENEQPLNERDALHSYLDSRRLSPELVQIIQEQKIDMRSDQEMQITPQPERAVPREVEMEI